MLKSKQITDANRAALIKLKGISASGGSVNITSQLTSALATAGKGGKSVPLQVSATGEDLGVVTIPGVNDVPIWNNLTGKKIGGSDEVYGRLTFSNPNYVVTFYQFLEGVETAFTFPSTTSIELDVVYVFDFYRLPVAFAISKNIYTDPASLGGGASEKFYGETLTATALNTLPVLAKTPARSTSLLLVVNNGIYTVAAGELTLSGKQLTWVRAVTGFDLETTDVVIAQYSSLE